MWFFLEVLAGSVVQVDVLNDRLAMQGKPTVDGAAGRAPPAAADGDPASPARSDRSKESHAPPIPPRPGHTNPLDALLNELQTFNKARRQVHRFSSPYTQIQRIFAAY